MRRRLTIIVPFCLLIGPSVALGHINQASQHYFLACESGAWNWYSIGHIVRFGTFDGAMGRVTHNHLWPCGPSNQTGVEGFAFVSVATLQSGSDLAQIGIAICRPPGTAPCDAGFPTYQHDFWYTKDANGVVFPATWYDWNGDGVHDRPVMGDEYRMWIVATVGSGGYYIQNVSAGTPYVGHSEVRHGASVPEAWWGFEVKNSAGVIGDRDIDPFFDMHLMQTHNNGAWSAALGGVQTVYWAPQDRSSWMGFTTSHSTSTDSHLDVYTIQHQ